MPRGVGLSAERADPARRTASRLSAVAFLVVALIGASAQFVLMTGTIVWYDEYAWAFRYEGLWSGVLTTWGGWVDPLTRLAYNALFSTAGLAHYAPYRVMGILANLTLAVATYCYARRAGRPWLGVAACLLLLLLGKSSMTVLMPLNSMNALGMASLPAGLLLLDKARRSCDLAAVAVLLVAMGFAGPVVVPVCLGLATWLLLERPVPWARLLVPGAPVVIFVAGRQLLPAQAHRPVPYIDNALAAPVFVAELASTGAAAVVGLPIEMGPAVLALLVVAAAVGIPRLPEDARRRVLALVATVLASWGVLALGRADLGDAQSPRYVVLTVAPVLLVGLELAGGHPSAAPARAGAFAGLLAFSLLGNLAVLRSSSSYFRTQAEVERAELGALELALDRAPPDYRPDTRPDWPLIYVTAGDWRRAVERLGSPAFTPREIEAAAEEARLQADRILLELDGIVLAPAPPGLGAGGGGGCTALGDDAVEVDVSSGGLPVGVEGGPVEVRARRFSGSFPSEPWRVLPAGFSGSLVARPDASAVPWRAQLRGGPGTVCPTGAGP